MAESTNNVVTHGMKGLIGKLLVFKQLFGKTIVARRPKKSNLLPSADQAAIQVRFKEAAFYAKNAILDTGIKAAYAEAAEPGQTAYNMAFADYFKPPVLSVPDISAYSGELLQKLRVRAIDNFRVAAVSVSITKADGTLVEQGQALITSNGLDWEYYITRRNDELPGSRVLFTATDLPGNNTTLELTVV